MLDITLLKIVKYRNEYNKLISSVPVNAFDPKTQALLADFGKYFKKFPTHSHIDIPTFLPRFKAWHPDMTDEQYNAYAGVLRTVSGDVDEETRNGIVGELYELDLATKVANMCNMFNQGDLDYAVAEGIAAALDTYKINMGAKAVQWDDTDITELLKEDLDNSGIRWRLSCLNESMRPLRPGDFGIIAGRPDKGKTTFLTSEVTYMANQMPDEHNVLWLNNEGMSGRIVKRLYQSALGLPISDMVELSKNGQLTPAYEEVVGRRDRIRVVNIHGFHVGQVEAIIENSNPGIIVYDMIDNIKGFGSESRTDLQLEEMYKWARERAVKYSCIGFASSQISNEGDELQFPTLGMLKDSKTGKQGACDFQLMIGAVDKPGLEYSRFIGLPKNKLRREDAPGNPKAEVQFNPVTARYEDAPIGG